ncbi:SpoIIE family protein phosphatase [Streptacidiphilus jiangxiensis]|uniref:Serine phosphatase RsbU, regulator of sigma subunit n=1 Tax=Streptacidiphilus jiangxiensis TaxID=235985 RepID=A0A1H7WQ89_STRJI|nr:SpoIIE family protein phosphatase [Streptacidiphilus jiangxiensis]SEM23117.1 Serine phosphatase RsbU, regulator of sigma subunit [Streptacidiphilus jiangxiensis]
MGAEAPKRDAAAAAMDAASSAMAGTPDLLSTRLLAALPVGVALLDADLRRTYANEAFLRLTDFDSAAATRTAAQVLADGETRELVVGPPEARVRMRLQRLDPEPPTSPEAGTPLSAVPEAVPRASGPAATAVAGAAGAAAAAGTAAAAGAMVLVVALLDAGSAPSTDERPDADVREADAHVADEHPAGERAAGGRGEPVAEAHPRGANLSRADRDGTVGRAGGPTEAGAGTGAETALGTGELPEPLPSSEAERLARRRLAMLTSAGERIGTTLDTDTTCSELARFTVPGLADLATVDILPPGVPEHRVGVPLGTLRLLRAAVAGRPELHQQLATLAHPGESVRHREGSLVARSLLAGKPIVLDLAATGVDGREGEEAAPISDPATLAVYAAAGVSSVVAVPLAARGHLIGALTLARAAASTDTTGEAYSEEDLALIEDLAGRAALSIDNARRYMRSQGIALELQRALLAEPASPHPNMEIACRYLPSGSSSVVGGDWYESVRLPFGRTLLVIGDVMGHGVEAAVDMSTYRSMLRYVAVMDLPPHRILRQLDAMISENEASRPATCLLALVDPPRNRVTFASAGHLPPALVGPSGATELVPVPSGPPLGTGVGGYQQLVRELAPGAVLLLYTDGLVERRHEDIDASLERLARLPLPAAGDLDDLLDAVLHSSTPSEAEDDIALLAARVRPRA